MQSTGILRGNDLVMVKGRWVKVQYTFHRFVGMRQDWIADLGCHGEISVLQEVRNIDRFVGFDSRTRACVYASDNPEREEDAEREEYQRFLLTCDEA